MASQNDLSNKTTIDDIQDFMKNLELDRWEVIDELPEKVSYDNVLFFQEEISDKNKYKNIANVHLLEGKDIVLVTVAKGLVDLSDEFVPQDDSFTSIYRVPESVAQYLESLFSEK
ncbi:hypothetical protein [Kineothrix sedimenti]|uniref:Uncharacterized protein n=1 Tax=Kineothrix sedimenti TaxID=3123317 RepID=A0ABZ3ET85_9FIRM